MINSYKELKVWQKAVELVEEVYILTSKFPKEEVQKMLNVLLRKLNEKNLKPKTQNLKPHSGQSLIEIIVALAIGGILIGGAAGTIALMLKSNLETRVVQDAVSLIQETAENVQAVAESDWHRIYDRPKGASKPQYIEMNPGGNPVIRSGQETVTINNRQFTRYFYIENVNRDACGAGDIAESAATSCSSWPGGINDIAEDPSTQKITIVASWQTGRQISQTRYLTRSRNITFRQTDWSGGPNQEGPITAENDKFASSTNVDYATSTSSITIQSMLFEAVLISSIFDTGVSDGVALNSIMWQGNQPSGTEVKFQITSAASSTGPWDYKGWDGSSSSYYVPAGVNSPVKINPAYHNNHRYFRYKIFLYSNQARTQSPRVDDAIINYSP